MTEESKVEVVENKTGMPTHHIEHQGEKTILRNPSPQEIQKIEKEGAAIAEPQRRPKTKKKTDVIDGDYGCTMKPKISDFEPKVVEFFLPSGNKIIQSDGITERGSIWIRRMTTVEESIIQTALMKDVMGEYGIANSNPPITLSGFLTILNGVIDPCIRSDVSINELSIVDKLPLIVKLVSLTYGKDLTETFMCEKCEQEYKHTVDLEKDIIISYVPASFEVPRKIELEDSFDFPVTIYLTMPVIGDEGHFVGANIDVLKQFESIVIDARGTKPDGTAITLKDLKDIVENLGDGDKEKIRDFVKEYSKYGTDLILKPFVLCTNTVKGKRCKNHNAKVENVRLPLQSLLNKMM